MRKPIWLAALALASCSYAAPIRHNYDLINVLWKITIQPEQHRIEGEDTNTVTLLSDSDTVQFHCMNLNVSSVTVNGVVAKFDTADDLLTVQLPSRGKAGQTLKFRAVYSGSPKRGLYFVDPQHAFPSKTGMVYSQGEGEDNRFWVPTYDLPDDKATSESFITVPKSWKAVSNGKFEGVTSQGETKTFHWKMSQPFSTYLISVVAVEYVEGKGQWHGIPVDYWVPPGLASEGSQSFSNTPKMIDLYSRLTGVDYPYPKFSQEVVGDFVVGGMENITAVTQMIRTLHVANSEPLNDSTGLVAHELAHQWFGDLITCRTWEHIWLNEGFATFLPIFLDREWHGQDWFDFDRYSNFEGAIDSIGSRGRKEVAGALGSVQDVTMGSPYPGGASRILMLMHRLGETTFWKGIHAFLTKYAFQPATTSEFFDVMSEVSGQDLGDFQSQWYHTAATPSLSVSTEGSDVVVRQLAPYYKLDLPVWFLDGQSWVKKSIHVDGPVSRMSSPLAGLPMLLDPEGWTIMELAYQNNQSAEAISSLYRHAPNPAAKARIVAELFPRLSVSDRIKLAREEKVAALVSLIAGRLGSEGQDYLVELTNSPDIRIANSAVEALGGFPQSAAAVMRLKDLAASHPNEALREHAMHSLLLQGSDASWASQAWGTSAFDEGFRVMALEWWASHDALKAREVSLQVLSGTEPEPVRIAACNALGRVKGGHEVLEALRRVATENSYRARLAAIRALGELGDSAALPTLQGVSRFEPGGIVGAAAASVKQIQDRK
jgi:aminopeptidase N